MTPEHSSAGTIARETTAAHMVTQIPRASRNTPLSSVIESLRGQKFECADTVFITIPRIVSKESFGFTPDSCREIARCPKLE